MDCRYVAYRHDEWWEHVLVACEVYQRCHTQSVALLRLLSLKTKMLSPFLEPYSHRRLERCFNGAGAHTRQKERSTKEYNESLVVDASSGMTNTSLRCPRTQSFPGIIYSSSVMGMKCIDDGRT